MVIQKEKSLVQLLLAALKKTYSFLRSIIWRPSNFIILFLALNVYSYRVLLSIADGQPCKLYKIEFAELPSLYNTFRNDSDPKKRAEAGKELFQKTHNSIMGQWFNPSLELVTRLQRDYGTVVKIQEDDGSSKLNE